jgi:hypothetical protein
VAKWLKRSRLVGRHPVMWLRRMQFEAGPQTQEFIACPAHLLELARGDVSCFYPIKGEPMRQVEVTSFDDYHCDFCREG